MSTPLKHYGSSEGFTPSTNNRSSNHDFASPSTAHTNYSPELIRKGDNDIASLMSGLSVKPSGPRHLLEDPFVDDHSASAAFSFSATAADYAPLTTAATVSFTDSSATNGSSPLNVVANRPTKLTPDRDTPVHATRYVKVVGPLDDDAGMTRIKDVKTMEASIATKKLDDGALIFRFDQVKEAQIACTTTRSLFNLGSFVPGWSAEFVPAADFHGDHSRDSEGQLKVAIVYQGESIVSEAKLLDTALAVIRPGADIMSTMIKSFSEEQQMLVFDAYLGSVRAAEAISKKFNCDWQVVSTKENFEIYIQHNCARFPISSKPWISSRSSAAASMRGTGYSGGQLDKENSKVNIHAIEQGEDCRTTVMIRNIPNKIDADMFKTILDEHVFGCYDFSYLRIDFANNCNVGYAFVNFKSERDIITLHDALVGKPWQVFSSDKIADICYATNQGLGTCVEKFRNSSVMLEWPPHRPKLWYTNEDGPELAGTEKPFPEPSNLQKLHRSRANASSIGLFPPRGLQFNDFGGSPTRGGFGDMPPSFGYSQSPQFQNGGPPMMSGALQTRDATYEHGYSNGARLHALRSGPMYEQVQPYQQASIPSARGFATGIPGSRNSIAPGPVSTFGVPAYAHLPWAYTNPGPSRRY